jgi:O-antigen ligase
VGVAAAAVLLAGLFIGNRSAAWCVMRHDPVFFLGLAFLVFLALQWANAGRVQYFDVGYQRWMYTSPPWPGWPSAYSRPDALQMLTWFFPAWVIVLVFRSRRLGRREWWGLLMLTACNAALLALFGVVQFASGTRSIYWIQPLKGHFFATFAYGNHAAPYFVLASALAAGLLFREVFDLRHSHADTPSSFRLLHPVRVAVLVPVVLLCLLGANLGLSRAGVILTWTLVMFGSVYGGIRAWRLLKPAGRINFVSLMLAVLASLYFAVSGFGEKGIRNEFASKAAARNAVHTVWDRINVELEGRPLFARAALAIWREHPWFGAGGWGFKYRVADHVPQDLWPALEKRGWANVHFDFLQFLVEFGVVGVGLLLGALGVLLRDLFRLRQCRHCALWAMGTVGLGLVVVFSLIDLPFRCPAILFVWVALLAALPRACDLRPPCETGPGHGGGAGNGRGMERIGT